MVSALLFDLDMTKYIDADRLKEAVEKEYNSNYTVGGRWELGYDTACEQILDIIDSLQQEQPMPDSTKLIELWHEDKEMLKEKDFRDDPWRLAYNAFMCGFGRGISVKKQEQPLTTEKVVEQCKKFGGNPEIIQQEQPEVDLEKFTEKMDAWKARYNYPDNIPIKAAMAFTARMFYQYPNVARQWYDSLPKATMD